MYTNIKQKGGSNSYLNNTLFNNQTTLIDAITKLQEQIDIGVISTTGVSSVSVVNYLSSAGYSQILALKQHLSSMFIQSVYDEGLLTDILQAHSYSSISEYNTKYAETYNDLILKKSTADGLKILNDARAENDLPIAKWQLETAEINYATDAATYSTSVYNNSTLSSFYICTLNQYSTAVAEYIQASTLEHTSTLLILPDYNNIVNAYWSSIQGVLGNMWIDLNNPTQSGGGELQNILVAYSSLQLSDNILHDITALNFFSSLYSTQTDYLNRKNQELSGYINCDYSTIISTYVTNIMVYKDEIMQCTSGNLHNQVSNLIGYSTLWLSALHGDIAASTNYAISVSTYNYYTRLIQNLSTHIEELSTIYRSTLRSFERWETDCCTNKVFVQFLELETAETGALTLFNSTQTLKGLLENLLGILGPNPGANVDSLFNSIQTSFNMLQSGGASLSEVQLMYDTVNVLYNRYSTAVVSTTQARVNAQLPPDINTIYANILSTQYGIHDQRIAYAQDIYNRDVLSSLRLTQEISSFSGYLSSFILTSTISDAHISSVYGDLLTNYRSTINSYINEKMLRQYQMSQCIDATIISSVRFDAEYNSIEQIILRLGELGYTFNTAQAGGGDIISELLMTTEIREIPAILCGAAENRIRMISSMDLTYLDTDHNGLIGQAAQAASTASTNYSLIIRSISDLNNATTNITTSTVLTTRRAVENLNTDAAQFYQYSRLLYAYEYSTSHFKYINYLACLRILSTQLTTNLLENRNDMTVLQWLSAPQTQTEPIPYRIITDPSTNVNLDAKIGVISTNIQKIREYRPILQSMTNMILAEELHRNYYLLQKSTFEAQQFYRLQKGVANTNMISAYDFDQLTTAYDVSIQVVNRKIDERKNMYNSFINNTMTLISNNIRPAILEGLKSGINPVLPRGETAIMINNVSTYVYSITSSLRMDFTKVPPRYIFPKSGIPTPTLVDCVSTNTEPSNVRTTTYPEGPTTTIDTVVRGVKGRYIKISKEDGVFEILQVCAINAKGKNVAFRRPVVAIPTTASITNLSYIVNGQYSANVSSPLSLTYNPPPNIIRPYIQIDLGIEHDITCIRYIKAATSTYNNIGLTFTILDSNLNIVGSPYVLNENRIVSDCDLRVDLNALMFMNPSRKGACGYFGKYLDISKPDNSIFKLSQIAIVSLGGNNAALNKPVQIDGTLNNTSIITDGAYYSRPGALCINARTIRINMDVETEVVAVHLYGISDGDQNINGIVANLKTEDELLAYSQTANTHERKQVLDFRYINENYTNNTCNTELLWPPYYGQAGIICRYIRLTRTSGQLGFTKVKVVDKAGRDVSLFKPVAFSSQAIPDSNYNGVSDTYQSKPLSQSYSSATGDTTPGGPFYQIDLERVYEICSITVYRCSDAPSLTDNVQIQLLGTTGQLLTQFSTPAGNNTIFYDTRYDADEHGLSYPIDSLSTLKSYGSFGTLALTVEIPGYVSTLQITEGSGQDLFANLSSTYIRYTSTLTAVNLHNLREVNTVICPSVPLGTRVILRDCDGYIVNNKPVQNYSTSTGVYRLADFRNPVQQIIYDIIPMVPIQFQGKNMGWSDDTNTYSMTNANGIAARYIKVSPPTGKKLYISQIIGVDSRGINVALFKDTFTTDGPSASRSSRAVDGEYEPKLDETTPTILSYENYICRAKDNSFYTETINKYWVVDLGQEYLINSVVFVAASGYNSDSINTIIELYNIQLRQVAVQVVSSYVGIFGVDILDFRINRTIPAARNGSYLEVRPRVITPDESGCGIMTQYIRLKGNNVKVSQLIAIDSTGKNVALYMPTYSNTNMENSYRLVDGRYYQKMETPVQGDTEAFIMNGNNVFVEVNFGKEIGIVSVFLVPIIPSTGTPYNLSDSNITIQLYNKDRDTIASIRPSQFENIRMGLNTPGLVYPSATYVIGVNILTKFADFKIQAGLMSADVLTEEDLATFHSVSGNSQNCVNELNTTPRFSRGATGGIPTRYIRVYNVSKYVQVSQIMAYGIDGTNFAYQKSAKSESIFPGTYTGMTTDGIGGYYHNARTCMNSYKSGGKRYDFLEIDLETTRDLVGLRCIFPSDNTGQNIGTRFHLLNSDGLVLAQYVVGSAISQYNPSKYEYEECIIDYRIQPVYQPISKIIMPKVASISGFGTTLQSPNGVVEVCSVVYVADTLSGKIIANNGSGTGTIIPSGSLLLYPTGLTSDGKYLYVASYGNNTIVQIMIESPYTATVLCAVPKPYGICINNGTLYITSYATAVQQYYTLYVGTFPVSTCAVMSGGDGQAGGAVATLVQFRDQYGSAAFSVNFPNSIAYIKSPGVPDYLLVSSMNDKCIYQVNITNQSTKKYIGTGSATIQLALAAPSAISYNKEANILFISDYVQNKIYSVRLDITKAVENIAGVGQGGFLGDGKQGILASFDGIMNILYSKNTGYLYISDYNNKRVRYLDVYSKPEKIIPTTTTGPQWENWTTTTIYAPSLNQSTLSSLQYTQAQLVPTNFSTIISPNNISTYRDIPGITAYYWNVDTHYYFVPGTTNGNLYRLGASVGATPVLITGQFRNITSMTINNGTMYVCSYDSTVWSVWTSSNFSTFTRFISNIGGTITYNLINPVYIGFDNRSRLYISDSGNNTNAAVILRKKMNTNELEVYVGGNNNPEWSASISERPYGTNIKIKSPAGFVFDSYNNLLFIDSQQETVYKVNDTNGLIEPICKTPNTTRQYLDSPSESSFPKTNATEYNIHTPFGITIDSSNNLYITSHERQQIVKLIWNQYNTDNTAFYSIDIVVGFGSFVNNFSTNSASVDTLAKYAELNTPIFIYYFNNNDTSGLYFSETNKIRKIAFLQTSSQPIMSLLPYGPLTIIANYSKNSYNTTISTPAVCEKFALMQNFNAASICSDTLGNVYFLDTFTNRIMKMDPEGNLSVFQSGFTNPTRIANYKDIYIYLVDGANIIRISIANGTRTTAFTLASGTYSNIAISPIGYMYVSTSTDPSSFTLYNLKTGQTIKGPVSTTLAGYTVVSIDSLCVDADSNLYIGIRGSSSLSRIFKYNYSDILAAGSNIIPAASTDSFSQTVSSIAFFNGVLYYTNNGCVSAIYALAGASPQINIFSTLYVYKLIGIPVIGKIGKNAPVSDGAYGNTTTLNNPLAISIDINGIIYIVDAITSSKTVIVKNATYTPLQSTFVYNITGTNTQGLTVSGMSAYMESFSSIKGVCYDSVGNIYISDSGQNTISKIDLTGKLTTFSGRISTTGSYSGDDGNPLVARLNNPTDIKMSKSDILYIADTNNNAIRRVKVYETDNFHIETYVSSIIRPTALAIDSYENIYAVTGESTISIISPVTETLSTVVNTGFNISALAINNSDQLYYTGNGALNKLGDVASQISGFIQPSGLIIESNIIYISDAGQNKVFSVLEGSSTTTLIAGSGDAEAIFNIAEDLPQNIYGNGVPPLTKAVSAPGALAAASSRGLLVAQPTKILMKPAVNYGAILRCGIQPGNLTIYNGGAAPIYLSQVVALDSTGTNILLKSTGASYFDGTYLCKGTASAWSINANSTLTIGISGTVACVFIYVGSTNKTRWNGATITFGTDTRYISGITEDPSIQYILLDYRTKTPACTPFINYVNKYKLQTSSSATTEPFRIQYARYVRITSTSSRMTMSRIYALDGETGQDRLFEKAPYFDNVLKDLFTLVANANDAANILKATRVVSLNTPIPFSNPQNLQNFWIEYDLGDEYPIEQVIIQQNTYTGTYSVSLYTSNRTQIQYPSTYSRFDSTFDSVVLQGVSPTPTISGNYSGTLSLLSPAAAASATATAVAGAAAATAATEAANARAEATRVSQNRSQVQDQLQRAMWGDSIDPYDAYNNTSTSAKTWTRYAGDKAGLAATAARTAGNAAIAAGKTVEGNEAITAAAEADAAAANAIWNGINVQVQPYSVPLSNILRLSDIYTVAATLNVAANDAATKAEIAATKARLAAEAIGAGASPEMVAAIATSSLSAADAMALYTTTWKSNLIYNQAQSATTITFTTTSQSTICILYNKAGEEITRRLLRGSPYSLPSQALTTLSYSFMPIIGLRRIRYIRVNAAISQIYVFDSNGINVINGKTPSFTGGASEIDLGQEYELIQMIFISAGTNTTISFLDAFRIQQAYQTRTGANINIDLRSDSVKHFIALPTISSGTTSDTSLTGFVSGRYVRFENMSPGVAFSITTPNMYDIYGKNIIIGKPITTTSPSTDYGASWEIDLGQEYPIRDIVYSGSSKNIAIYNRYRAEIWRNYINAPMMAPFPLHVATTMATGTSLRFIRITGICTIHHVAIIDTRGIDMAVWKPIIKTTNGTKTYNTFNGLYASSHILSLATDYIEVDLGKNYYIKDVQVYLSAAATPTVVGYTFNSSPYFTGSTTFTLPNTNTTVTSTTNMPTITRYNPYGQKTRYVNISSLNSSSNIRNLAVIDSLGRNLSYNIQPFSNSYDSSVIQQNVLSSSTFLDLGEEHYVASVVLYHSDQTLNNGTITLLDTYYKLTGTRTLLNPIDTTIASAPSASITSTTAYTSTHTIIDFAIDSSNNIYILRLSPVTFVFSNITAYTYSGNWGNSSVSTINITSVTSGRIIPPLSCTFNGVTFNIINYNGSTGGAGSYVLDSNLVSQTWPTNKTVTVTNGYYNIIKNPSSNTDSSSINTYISDNNTGFVPTGQTSMPLPILPKSIYIDSTNSKIYISTVRTSSSYNLPGGAIIFESTTSELLVYPTTVNSWPYYPTRKDGMASSFNHTVFMIDPLENMIMSRNGNTGFVRVITASHLAYDATFLSITMGVGISILSFARDPTGTIYCFKSNGELYKLTKSASSRSAYTSAIFYSNLPTTGLIPDGKKSIAVDSSTNVYIIDPSNNAINVMNSNGIIKRITPTSGTSSFSNIGSICVDISNNIFFISGNNIIKYTFSGTLFNSNILSFYTPSSASWESPLQYSSSAQIIDFDPPTQPTFTISSVTNTNFLLTLASVGSDYATSYTYSLNGGAAQPLTLSGSNTATFTAYNYSSVVVTALNSSGSTVSLVQYVQLLPPAPLITVVAGSITSTGFSITWTNVVEPMSGYTRSYTYSLNGGAATAVAAGATTVSITGLSAGSNPNIVVRAIYTSGATDLTSSPSNSLSIQLLPPVPSISLVGGSITSTGFNITWTHVPLPGNGSYTRSYTYSLNGGADIAVAAGATTASITGLAVSSNPNIVVRAIYTFGASALNSTSNLLSIQLLPITPVLTASNITGYPFDSSMTITWPPATAPSQYTTSYVLTLTNALIWDTAPITTSSTTGTNKQIAFYNGTLSIFTNRTDNPTTQWYTILPIQIYNHTTTYFTGSFVLYTDNNAYIAAENYPSGGRSQQLPTVTTYWMKVATLRIITETLTTASKTFTNVIKLPDPTQGPTVSVITRYTSIIDSTIIPSAASNTLLIELLPPAPIISVVASSITSTGFTISLTNATPPMAGYTRSYSYSLNGGAAVAVAAGATTVSITGLTAGSNQNIVVRAIDTFGANILTSPPSNSLTIQLSPSTPVISVVAGSITSTGFNISLTNVADPIAGYTRSYSYSVNGGTAIPIGTAATTVSITGLTASSNPTISLRTIYTSGATVLTSPESNSLTIQLAPQAPPAPSISVVAGSTTSTSFSISWSHVASPGNGSYTRSYTYSLNGGAETPVAAGATSLTFTGLTVATYYYIWVKAKYTSGATVLTSPESNGLHILTTYYPPPPPPPPPPLPQV